MFTTTHTETIAAPADAVWRLVGTFGDSSWMGGIELTADGDGLGAVRKVGMPTGVITELCEVHDPSDRTMGYTITDGNPFPCTDYHGTITVTPDTDDSCTLTWASRYETSEDPASVDGALSQFLAGAAGAVRAYAERNR